MKKIISIFMISGLLSTQAMAQSAFETGPSASEANRQSSQPISPQMPSSHAPDYSQEKTTDNADSSVLSWILPAIIFGGIYAFLASDSSSSSSYSQSSSEYYGSEEWMRDQHDYQRQVRRDNM